jgi:MFS family permease
VDIGRYIATVSGSHHELAAANGVTMTTKKVHMTHPQANGGMSRAGAALDAANFFLADVRDGLGPYLAIYLLTEQRWNEADIGIVMSIATAAGILAQTPAGALVDATRAKRAVMVAAAVLVTASSLMLPWFSSFLPVALSQATAHAAGVVFGPALAAVSLGIVGHAAFTRRIGRNETFNHAGNAFAAAAAGGAAYLWGPTVVFYLIAAMSVASLVSVLAIPARAIDHDLARGLTDGAEATEEHDKPSGFAILLTCRPLLIFAACAVLFHLANAAMLPLVGQKLALQDKNLGTSMMSACIVAAQIVMVPMAMLVGAKADAWGRKPLFMAALMILPIRGALYTLSDNAFWLVGVQLLDGVGAGIYGAIFPLIVADLMRGTGRFNVAQGAVITAQGIGAALSTTLAGLVVVSAGYGAAFLTLGAVAAVGLALFALAMPETAPRGRLWSGGASRPAPRPAE